MTPERKANVPAGEYWKHARPWMKRKFWKAVRRAVKRDLARGG